MMMDTKRSLSRFEASGSQVIFGGSRHWFRFREGLLMSSYPAIRPGSSVASIDGEADMRTGFRSEAPAVLRGSGRYCPAPWGISAALHPLAGLLWKAGLS